MLGGIVMINLAPSDLPSSESTLTTVTVTMSVDTERCKSGGVRMSEDVRFTIPNYKTFFDV